MNFKITIVGRPNVGKSTLFNRLVGRNKAIVHDFPGVTRDWQESPASLFDRPFTIIDTAGLDRSRGQGLASRMTEQSLRAAAMADLVFFLVDAKSGVMAEDRTLAETLRKLGKPVFLIVNKSENKNDEDLADFHALGLQPIIAISASHGLGLDALDAYLGDYIKVDKKLSAKIAGQLAVASPKKRGSRKKNTRPDDDLFDFDSPEIDESAIETKPLKIAVVGKPNAGKSTLINQIIGRDRLLTGPEAGITRDAVTVPFVWQGRAMELVDTAGLRKKSKVVDKLEQLAASDTVDALNMAEIVIVMLDVSQGITHQDLTIAQLAADEGRGVIIAINKWDLIRDKSETRISVEAMIAKSLPQIAGVPILYTTATAGKNIDKVLNAALELHKFWNKRISTGKFNYWLKRAVESTPPPMARGRRLKLRYGTQIKTRPPTFVLFASNVYEMPDTYVRYLTNKLRDSFDLPGVPIRIYLRQGDNPYDRD